MKRRNSAVVSGYATKRRRLDEPEEMDIDGKEVENAVMGESVWPRPPVRPLGEGESLFLQQIDTDVYTGFPITQSLDARAQRQARPVIRIYGVTREGNSCLVHVHGFAPYFFIRAWNGFDESRIPEFQATLNKAIGERASAKQKCEMYVTKIVPVEKQTVWGFQFKSKSTFLKIYVALPQLVPTARTLCKAGVRVPGKGVQSFDPYESNIPFVLRFMIDKSIVGGGWIEVDSFRSVPEANKTSRCQIEVETTWKNVSARNLNDGPEWSDIPPVRILSFDIECWCDEGFPDATRMNDKVIQIANVVQVQGRKEPLLRNVFTLDTCDSIAGCDVRSYRTEKEMLLDWANFVRTVDPDIITGYNIVNFDLPYLITRAETLRANTFPYLGRVRNNKTNMKERTFSSRAYGTSNSKEILIEGRCQMDLLPIIRRDHKLRSYSLNSVSFHFLKQQKEDVHYSIIGKLQNGDSQDRRRLAVYCLKDAVLPLRLMEKLMVLINYIEMARVTGVPIPFLITRGQQIKVLSQLYRKAMTKEFVIPVHERQQNTENDTFDGATVIEPKRAFYTEPVTTLDFASLYPSIMMAHNLCYTTMISDRDAARLRPEQYTVTPTGNKFVKSTVQKGLLPEILEELLSARKQAKREMKAETDPFRKGILNGRQLALKISANSVYGFTGATVGSLPCLSISASVTSFGRQMIDQTKSIVEAHYTTANGYSSNAEVIYGDTDSVMIKFGIEDMKESMRLGEDAAGLVSGNFINPIKLEFEKVYKPYLLMNKKRYAGMLWTNPDHWAYMDAKGIETVRRDNCELVKATIQRVLDHILIDEDPLLAQQFAKDQISKLLQNKLDMSLLVITKALGKMEDYKVKTAHVELAKRMAKRDPASAPKTGERVAYVFVKGTKGSRAYENTEDPLYVLENGIPVDADYYLEHQLRKPLTRIFEPILGEKISSLFHGDHTRKIRKPTPRTGPLARFAKVQKTCIGCKVPLKNAQASVCGHCQGREGELYMKQVEQVNRCESDFHMLWTQCQRCQGSMTQEVLCSNRDCPIFYRRTKARKELEQAHKLLSQFSF